MSPFDEGCSRDAYLDQKEEMLTWKKEYEDCRNRRMRPGYENLMKLKGAYARERENE
jgi:hypothetical protein